MHGVYPIFRMYLTRCNETKIRGKENSIMDAMKELPVVILKPPPEFVYDKRRKGWTLSENVPFGEGEVSLRLDEFVMQYETYISGHETMKRAKAMGNLAGQLHAERLLYQRSNIPVEWRGFSLVFPGTVWRHPDGSTAVPCLDYLGFGRWWLNFGWLGGNFTSCCRFVRLGK